MTTNETVIGTRTWLRRRRRLGRGLAASIAVATLILAGCGGGSDDATESPSTAASEPDTTSSSTADSATETTAADAPDASGDPCRLLTAEEAEAALGRAVAPPVKTEIPDTQYGSGFDCAYGAVDQSGGSASVHVGLLGDQFPRDEWEQAERAEGYEEVAGVGELAFFDGDSKLDVFDDGRWIQVQMIGSTRFDEQLALLMDIARNALERI